MAYSNWSPHVGERVDGFIDFDWYPAVVLRIEESSDSYVVVFDGYEGEEVLFVDELRPLKSGDTDGAAPAGDDASATPTTVSVSALSASTMAAAPAGAAGAAGGGAAAAGAMSTAAAGSAFAPATSTSELAAEDETATDDDESDVHWRYILRAKVDCFVGGRWVKAKVKRVSPVTHNVVLQLEKASDVGPAGTEVLVDRELIRHRYSEGSEGWFPLPGDLIEFFEAESARWALGFASYVDEEYGLVDVRVASSGTASAKGRLVEGVSLVDLRPSRYARTKPWRATVGAAADVFVLDLDDWVPCVVVEVGSDTAVALYKDSAGIETELEVSTDDLRPSAAAATAPLWPQLGDEVDADYEGAPARGRLYAYRLPAGDAVVVFNGFEGEEYFYQVEQLRRPSGAPPSATPTLGSPLQESQSLLSVPNVAAAPAPSSGASSATVSPALSEDGSPAFPSAASLPVSGTSPAASAEMTVVDSAAALNGSSSSITSMSPASSSISATPPATDRSEPSSSHFESDVASERPSSSGGGSSLSPATAAAASAAAAGSGAPLSWSLNDEVEAYFGDGWYAGHVTDVDVGFVIVVFDGYDDEAHMYRPEELRRRHEESRVAPPPSVMNAELERSSQEDQPHESVEGKAALREWPQVGAAVEALVDGEWVRGLVTDRKRAWGKSGGGKSGRDGGGKDRKLLIKYVVQLGEDGALDPKPITLKRAQLRLPIGDSEQDWPVVGGIVEALVSRTARQLEWVAARVLRVETAMNFSSAPKSKSVHLSQTENESRVVVLSLLRPSAEHTAGAVRRCEMPDIRIPLEPWPAPGEQVEALTDSGWSPGTVLFHEPQIDPTQPGRIHLLLDGEPEDGEPIVVTDERLRPIGGGASASADGASETEAQAPMFSVGEAVEAFVDGHWAKGTVRSLPDRHGRLRVMLRLDSEVVAVKPRDVRHDHSARTPMSRAALSASSRALSTAFSEDIESSMEGPSAVSSEAAPGLHRRDRAKENIAKHMLRSEEAKHARRARARAPKRRSRPQQQSSDSSDGDTGTEVEVSVRPESAESGDDGSGGGDGDDEGGATETQAQRKAQRAAQQAQQAKQELERLRQVQVQLQQQQAQAQAQAALQAQQLGTSSQGRAPMSQRRGKGDSDAASLFSNRGGDDDDADRLPLWHARRARFARIATKNALAAVGPAASVSAGDRRAALDAFYMEHIKQAVALRHEQRLARLHAQVERQSALAALRKARASSGASGGHAASSGTLRGGLTQVIATPGPFHWGLARAFPPKGGASGAARGPSRVGAGSAQRGGRRR